MSDIEHNVEMNTGRNQSALQNGVSQNDELVVGYKETEDLLQDAILIIDRAKEVAYQAVNVALIQRNWLLGHRIDVEILHGEQRADYGEAVINKLALDLTSHYGKGFDASNLYKFLQFSRLFPEILDAARLKSLSLTWSHYRSLLRVDNKGARDWYLKEAASQMWSTRTLDRNIASQYYFRLLKSQDKQAVEDEMKQKTKSFQNDKLEFVKNPVVAEFLGLSPNSSFVETELESAIISNLQQFLLELGKGFSFVARQKLVRTEKRNYYIDLVFYNYILKCFVLFDLKTDTISHQDVGQMDMYVRMFDEQMKGESDNPTIGIVLSSDTDADIAKYSVLHDNDHLFQAKYMLYMPSEEELRNEIEQQKEVFRLQHLDN